MAPPAVSLMTAVAAVLTYGGAPTIRGRVVRDDDVPDAAPVRRLEQEPELPDRLQVDAFVGK